MTTRDLTKEIGDLDSAAIDSLRDAERTAEGVRLPFPVAYLHVQNGDLRMEAVIDKQPALYFGGWAADADKIGELVESGDAPAFPKGWAAFNGISERGTWNGLCARAVSLSSIAWRQRWLGADGMTASPKFDREGGFTRRHLQVLGLLYNDGKPWGACVLTAKGYQAQYVLQALTEWGKAIMPFKKELNATQFPLSAFVVTLGTAGEKPEVISVGSTVTNKITPIRAILPELNTGLVAARFIGAAMLRANAEKLAQAREWLEAWKVKEAPEPESETEEVPW